jgi:hypothetical protein
MGIAVMSKLPICASRVTDFEIDKIDKEKTPLIIHPSSFRTPLVQIVNEAYNDFMKAHTNMKKIQPGGPGAWLGKRLRQNNQIRQQSGHREVVAQTSGMHQTSS